MKIADNDNKNDQSEDLINQQTKQIEQMKEELDEYKNKLEDHMKDTDLLKKLYDNGYIDLDGNPILEKQRNDEMI